MKSFTYERASSPEAASAAAQAKLAAHGFIIQTTISKGTVSAINTSAAERVPGVLMVTHLNEPKQAARGPIELPERYARSIPSKCEVALSGDGVVSVKMTMTDIGTGSCTVHTQIAAEMLGLPIKRVRMELGYSDFPATPGFGDSWGVQRYRSAHSRVSVDARQGPCRAGDK